MEEQQPSPQSVGREFVRQYYTLLNKAPSHLHRFYNNNSSFIHGESTLVVGQKNIHNRIQQLNFRDCHAKISQVDAQATLGNGVVVQVTGELSNDGQPMRRFTQTFVLAAQSPKKYYVHNDIFRYQDMYSDEENDGESRSENDEEHDIEQQQQQPQQQGQVAAANNLSAVTEANAVQQVPPPQQQPPQQQVVVAQPQAQQQAIYYSMPQTVVAGAPRAVPVIAAQTVSLAQFPAPTAAQQTQLNGGVVHEDLLATSLQQQTVQQQAVQAQQPLQQQQMQPPVQTNVAPAVVSVVPPQVLPQQPAQVAVVAAAAIPQVVAQMPSLPASSAHSPPLPVMGQAITVGPQGAGPVPTIKPMDSSLMTGNTNANVTSSVKEDDIGNYNDQPGAQDYQEEQPQSHQEKYEVPKSSHEPKTYANLFKSTATVNPSSPGSGYVPLPPVQNQMNVNQQSQQQSLSSSSSVYKNDQSRMIDNNMQTGGTGQAPLPQRTNTTRINKDFEQRRPGNNNNQPFSDSNQLFLGNVPHRATEEELKAMFSRFGEVVELRIHSKSSPKVPGIRNPQNYGFITYQDPQSVENCLSHCPLYYPENSPDGQKLNVEEKKTRLRNPNDLPPRQSNNMSGNNGGNGNNMGNSQRPNIGQNRSLSNTGGMMRGNPGNNSLSRGSSGGPRMGGGFNRNDSRGPPGSGPQSRGGNGNSGSNTGGGGTTYNRR